MATPSGTITLSGGSILAESYNSGTLSNVFPPGILGRIIGIGSDVADWSVNDVVVFSKIVGIAFTEDGSNYLVFPQEYILFKYTEPA